MTDLHCADQSQALGESPAGSATAADHFVLAELPMPWPAKIEQHSLLADLPARPDDAPTVRVLGVRRGDGDLDNDGDDGGTGRAKVISYRRDPNEPFRGYERRERDVDPEHLAATLTAVVSDSDQLELADDHLVDVLLCAHGTRDRRCGQFGTLLFVEAVAQPRADTRYWRASHTGGHRFAPTGITFPDGMTWAYLDLPTLAGILDRTVSPANLTANNRGCAGLGSRPAQIADLTMFEQQGWSWLDAGRRAAVEQRGEGEWDVLISAADERFLLTVRAGEPLPVPVCTEPLEMARKLTPQLAVEHIRPL